MLKPTETHVGIPWDSRTPYERWVEDDLKLTLHRGYFTGPLLQSDFRPWPERGLNAAFWDITGAESLAGLYVAELPPARSSERTRQLYDEVIYVIEGEGMLHMNASHRALRPGSCVHLPPLREHCLENTGSAPMRVLGVFHPSGDPASRAKEEPVRTD